MGTNLCPDIWIQNDQRKRSKQLYRNDECMNIWLLSPTQATFHSIVREREHNEPFYIIKDNDEVTGWAAELRVQEEASTVCEH